MENQENNMAICRLCGATLVSKDALCPYCGGTAVDDDFKASQSKTEIGEASYEYSDDNRVCENCGAELAENQRFCPNCGIKTGGVYDMPPVVVPDSYNETKRIEEQEKKKKIKIAFIIAAIVIIGLFIIGACSGNSELIGTSVEEVVLSEDTLEMKEGDTVTVYYTLVPSDASDKSVKWKSSNEWVATVNSSGKITAISDGSCVITVTIGGESDSLTVTVKTGPDFQEIYNAIGGDGYYCEVANDGRSMTIDTNPLDLDDYSSSTAWNMVKKANKELGLPSSVDTKMGQTRALDGVQTHTSNGVTVSWSYHPDNGLMVIYELSE